MAGTNDLQIFTDALRAKKKVLLTFYSKEDGNFLVRTCAPMDFGPSRRAKDKSSRFHFWDYDSDTARHTLSLLPEQVKSIQATNEDFEPSGFITWSVSTSPWFTPRDWGEFS